VVDAVRPLSIKEVPVCPDATRLPDAGVKPDVVLRYTLYVTVHDEPAELALQLRPIWLPEVAAATGEPGMLGAAPQPVLPPAVTVRVAGALVMEPAAFVTTTAKLVPLFFVVRAGVV